MGALERTIAAMAARNGGHASAGQLLALGLSRRQIRRRIESGFLIAVFHGVYAVARRPALREDQAKGALLAAGRGAASSHGSAAYLHAMFYDWREPIEVIAPHQRRLAGVTVHRAAALEHTTSPPSERVETNLRELPARFPRSSRAKPIRNLLDSPEADVRSTFESDWIPFAAKHGMPAHRLNVYIRTTRVDVLFLPNLLIVELDGWGSHGTQQAFEDGRDNPAEIYADEHIPTLRIARKPFLAHPAAHADRLHRILAQRRRELGLAA